MMDRSNRPFRRGNRPDARRKLSQRVVGCGRDHESGSLFDSRGAILVGRCRSKGRGKGGRKGAIILSPPLPRARNTHSKRDQQSCCMLDTISSLAYPAVWAARGRQGDGSRRDGDLTPTRRARVSAALRDRSTMNDASWLKSQNANVPRGKTQTPEYRTAPVQPGRDPSAQQPVRQRPPARRHRGAGEGACLLHACSFVCSAAAGPSLFSRCNPFTHTTCIRPRRDAVTNKRSRRCSGRTERSYRRASYARRASAP